MSAGYRDELITAATDRLADLGMLNDEAFATQWVESRDRARPRGERALRQELRQKGIDADTIAHTLEERRVAVGEGTSGDEVSADESAGLRLLARHAATLGRVVDPRVRRQRAYALLARSGFDPDTAARLAARSIGQE